MSRAADVRLCIAPPTVGATAIRPLSMLRAARMRELYLLWHLSFCVLLEWRARREPMATLEYVVAFGSGALSRRERAEFAEALADELAHPEPLESPAFLEAAVRWLCRVKLPSDEAELMDGPPLWMRRQR